MKEIEPPVFTDMIEEMTKFLNGGVETVKKELEEKMLAAAENLEFERAKEFRDQITHIDTVMQKQKMVSSDTTNRDVFGYAVEKGWMCVQVFFVRQGKLIERDVSIFPIYRDAEEEFLTFVGRFYDKPEHIQAKRNLHSTSD